MAFREELKALVDKCYPGQDKVNVLDSAFSTFVWRFQIQLEEDLDNLIKSRKGEEPLKPDNFWIMNTPTYESPYVPIIKEKD